MPGYPNKIIINSWLTAGQAALIATDYDSLKYLGQELIEMDAQHDTLKDTVDLRDKLESVCTRHSKQAQTYHDDLQALITETRRRIDAKLFPFSTRL